MVMLAYLPPTSYSPPLHARSEVNNGGLYPAPIFHMDSIWIPCGFHPFHMEYVLAGIPLIFLIPFHFDSMWIPYGMTMDWSYSITIPWNVHMESTWNDHGFHME